MLTNRIMGAITFRKGVYSEVANDASFTQTAWLIVLVVTLLSQYGARAVLLRRGFFLWLAGGLVGAVFGVLGFALTAFLVAWVGKSMFKSSATFDQMVRALGLAHVWNVVGVIGILGIIPVLGCVLGPVGVLAGLAGLAAYLFAIRETTGMDWVGTIATVVVALIIQLVAAAIAGGFLALIGIGAALITN